MIKSILKNSWVFSLACFIVSGYFSFFDILYNLQARLANNIQFVIDPLAYKVRFTENFDLLQAKFIASMPYSIIHSNANVGYFGYIPYPMIFLADKYRPMPVYTSFAASTLSLSDLNMKQLQELPDWLLVNYTTIDGRYIQQDDPWQQYYIARNFTFNQMTEYGALLERVKSKWSYRLAQFAPPVLCTVPCSISIPTGKAIVVKFLPYDSSLLSRFIIPFFRLRLDFEDRESVDFRMSYSSAQIGLFANVLSMRYAYPHPITPADSRVVGSTISCSPRFVCPTAIQYSLEEIIYDD